MRVCERLSDDNNKLGLEQTVEVEGVDVEKDISLMQSFLCDLRATQVAVCKRPIQRSISILDSPIKPLLVLQELRAANIRVAAVRQYPLHSGKHTNYENVNVQTCPLST